MFRYVFALISLACLSFHATSSTAGILPGQTDICSAVPAAGQTTPVSKRLFASFLLAGNPAAIKRVFGDPVLWNAIFTQEEAQFCARTAVCRGVTGDDCIKQIEACQSSKMTAIVTAQDFLDAVAADTNSKESTFRMRPALVGLDRAARVRAYFLTAADTDIECIGPKTARVPRSPAAADASPLRVRGVSNDLLLGRDSKSFPSLSQATLTVSGDHTTNQTRNVKATGAIGYAFEGDLTTAVPYISFYQSITDVRGKATSYDANNFVAAGMMFTSTVPGDVLVQTFAGKPQFLENTKDRSQIATLTLLYRPFTAFDVSNGGFNINDPRPIPFWPSAYAEILFDLRANFGRYTDRGIDPVQRLLNQDYARAGAKFGFSITTDSAGPSFTLTVLETYLHGFAGSVRNLDLFEASLTYNFDEKKYVGLKASYTKGRNEDTALPVQTWLVGLSARY